MSIYKRQSDDVKTFDTPQEFLKFYDNNQKDVDAIHTRSLNLKYKINGHHIGRKQGKLILYPTENKNVTDNIADNSTDNLEERYNKLKDFCIDLADRLYYIENYLSIKK